MAKKPLTRMLRQNLGQARGLRDVSRILSLFEGRGAPNVLDVTKGRFNFKNLAGKSPPPNSSSAAVSGATNAFKQAASTFSNFLGQAAGQQRPVDKKTEIASQHALFGSSGGMPADKNYKYLVLSVSSSWVQKIAYDGSTEELWIQFKDATCKYQPISPAMAESFRVAPSKGKWIWHHIIKVWGARNMWYDYSSIPMDLLQNYKRKDEQSGKELGDLPGSRLKGYTAIAGRSEVIAQRNKKNVLTNQSSMVQSPKAVGVKPVKKAGIKK